MVRDPDDPWGQFAHEPGPPNPDGFGEAVVVVPPPSDERARFCRLTADSGRQSEKTPEPGMNHWHRCGLRRNHQGLCRCGCGDQFEAQQLAEETV